MANCRLTVFSSFSFFSCVAYCSTPLCHVYCIYTLPSTFGPGEIEATMPPYLLLVTGNDIARIERQSRWQQVPWSPWRCPFLVCIYTCVFRLEAEGELRGNAFDSLCLTAASNLIKLGTREINPEILPRARRCWKGGLVHQSITSVAVATSMSLSLSLSLWQGSGDERCAQLTTNARNVVKYWCE